MPITDQHWAQLEDHLQAVFEGSYKNLIARVDRWTQTAAPLNPNSGNTLQVRRWELSKDQYPYLYATKEECESSKHRLLAHTVFMEGALPAPQELQDELLQLYEGIDTGTFCPVTGEPISVDDVQVALDQTSRIGRSELNVIFTTDLAKEERLKLQDLSWMKPPYYLYYLRDIFEKRKRLLPKVQTKAYLTDRRQTGIYPTNREARWEAHPQSPQFATYLDCIYVEVKLLAQVLEFSGAPELEFPEEISTQIETVIDGDLKPGAFRCPISGQFIKYGPFIQAVEDPEHGRAQHQVAHLVPLALTEGRHVASNVSWITELGNRVQGEDALFDITEKIFMMAQYHKERLGITWEELEQIVDKSEKVKGTKEA